LKNSIKFLLFISLVASCLNAKVYRFAIVPKNTNSPFFSQVEQGCKKVAKELGNVECLYVGKGEANPRYQVKILENLIKSKVDGISISVIDSNYFIKTGILKKIKDANIPLITFDSDLSKDVLKKYPNLRLAYIGTNNFKFGKELGKALLKQRPNGATFCIQSGWKNSPNLNRRIIGIRASILNTNDENILKEKIKDGKYKEFNRCPIYCNDDKKRALYELKILLKDIDTFVAVGGWAQHNEKNYENAIKPFKKDLLSKKKILIMGDTSPTQLNILKDGLSTINIGQNPTKMGEESINTLYKIKTNQEYEKIIYTPLTYCTEENYETCTK